MKEIQGKGYYFIEKYQGSYQYVDMENTPQIIKYK